MSMEDSVDSKRYKIIGLLYLVFICFAIVNIKVSVLDSNIYTIKSLQSVYFEDLRKINISNEIIENNITQLEKNPKASSFLNIRSRLSKSISIIDSVLLLVNDEFIKYNTSLNEEFNQDKLIEEIYTDINAISKIQKDLFSLSKYISKSQYKIDTKLDSLIPIQSIITNMDGNSEDFEDYLFKNKPTAVSYLQLERIKLLLIHNQLLYQEAALLEINYKPTYFSDSNKILYPINDLKKTYTRNENKGLVQNNIIVTDDIIYKSFVKTVMSNLHTENIFVGLSQPLINSNLGNNFTLEITPETFLAKKDNNYYNVIFNKQGEYTLRFYDIRKGKVLLFEKNIYANPIPDPVIRIKGDNFNYIIKSKDILNSNRLEPILKINNLKSFPGRISTFRLLRIHNGKETESILNYGELFQIPAQKLIGNLKKDDFLIIDNVTTSLYDGTSRISSPLMYKIIE
jgi:hypothetical protein